MNVSMFRAKNENKEMRIKDVGSTSSTQDVRQLMKCTTLCLCVYMCVRACVGEHTGRE